MASLKNTRVFDPRSISNCALWLDAADRSLITFSGSSITQWNDKSTTNTVALTSNGASANPILYQNGGVYINNNSSETYNASTYSMMVVQSNIMTSTDYTIAMVVNNPTNSTPALFSDQRAAGSSETRSQLNHGFIFEVSTGGSGRFTSPTTAAGTGTRILIGTSVPAQSEFYNNGLLTGSNTSAITSYSTDAGGLPTLGGYRDTETARTDNSWFTGTIFEVIFYRSSLTTSQRQQLEGYLAWKWGLQANLPLSHPFKQAIAPFPYSLQVKKFNFTQIFDPRSISGLQLWLDAATSFPTFTNGQAITRWVDKTSNGWVGTAVNSPTYQTNVQNGLPVIRFNGTNQYIDFGNILNLGTNGLSIFVVTKFVAAVSGGRGIISKSSYRGNPGRWGFNYEVQFALGMDTFIEDGTNAQATFAFNPATQFNVYSTQNNRTSFNRNFANGRLGAASSYTQTPSNLSNTDKLYVAAYPNNTGLSPQAGYYLNGDIGEILVYFANLSDAQRQQVEGYLARKWGVSLVSTHPNANTLTIAPFPHTISRIPFAPTAKWRPTQISGCALWLDAADPSRFTVSGTTITQWRDKIASRNFNGTATLASSNSLPCVRLNGSQKLTSTTNFTFAEVCTNSANMTCFLVLNVSSTTNVNSSAFSLNEAQPRFIPFYNGSGGVFFDAGQQANPRLSGSFTNNTRQIHVFLRTNVLTLQFRVNGTQNASNRFASPANFGNQTYSVNIAPTGAGGSWIGDIHEILYFSNEIGIANIQLVEGYLAWKWRLQANLPASHPYAKFPPTP